MKTFNTIEEFNQYVDKDGNFYYEGDVKISFHLDFKGNISAGDINAMDIRAKNITAGDVIAGVIIAEDINYFAICIAYHSLKFKSIEGRRKNSIHKCLDNEIKIL